ncbi:hypothetical protein VTK73DRAFT_1400 [Phialemonium thermophilum]|uniref:Uncharacterized protein n=1 Tax=Phialemonium thermophilum TaxID=223376 RepID=A0ABR3XAI5_9PEZI
MTSMVPHLQQRGTWAGIVKNIGLATFVLFSGLLVSNFSQVGRRQGRYDVKGTICFGIIALRTRRVKSDRQEGKVGGSEGEPEMAGYYIRRPDPIYSRQRELNGEPQSNQSLMGRFVSGGNGEGKLQGPFSDGLMLQEIMPHSTRSSEELTRLV